MQGTTTPFNRPPFPLQTSRSHGNYIDNFSKRGDLLQENHDYVRDHGLFVDSCYLIQGFFEDTLTSEFKKSLMDEGRQIGFACLDCNIGPPYKIVFEFIFDLLAQNSYIYMDEYCSTSVQIYLEQFKAALREKRNIGTYFIRNAGGFGGLVGLYPLDAGIPPLEL